MSFIAISGKSSPIAEASPVTVTPEEIDNMEKKNELRLKIKEEHLAALQFEGSKLERTKMILFSRK